MHCVVTTASYTANEDFTGAARVVPNLGDGDTIHFTLADCQVLCG